jgi:hypothetical protein
VFGKDPIWSERRERNPAMIVASVPGYPRRP